MKSITIAKLLKGFDWPIFVSVLLLTILGLSVIYSTTLSGGSLLFIKQIISLLIGIVIMVVVSFIDYRRWGSLSWWLYGFSLLLLIAVLIFGTNVRGTTGWFIIGSFSAQPVELVKIFVVITLGYYISQHTTYTWHDWWKTLLILVPVMVLLAMQPDFGPIFIMGSVWLLFNALRGLSLKGWLIVIGSAVIVALLAWFVILREDQKDRLKTFVNPSQDPAGRGFQVRQSIIAIGSGGITGTGLGEGIQSQLKFLPEAPTDFVFAALLEQLGLVGFLILLLLWIILFGRIIVLIRRARDNYTLYVSLGLGLLLFVQTSINVGMNLGLAPIVGLPLPFLSYGGSALISMYFIVGILESIAIRQRIA